VGRYHLDGCVNHLQAKALAERTTHAEGFRQNMSPVGMARGVGAVPALPFDISVLATTMFTKWLEAGKTPGVALAMVRYTLLKCANRDPQAWLATADLPASPDRAECERRAQAWLMGNTWVTPREVLPVLRRQVPGITLVDGSPTWGWDSIEHYTAAGDPSFVP